MTVTTDRKHVLADVKVLPRSRTVPVQNVPDGTEYIDYTMQSPASNVTVTGWLPRGSLSLSEYTYVHEHWRDHLRTGRIGPVYTNDPASVIVVYTHCGKDQLIEFIPAVTLDSAIEAARARLDGLLALRG